MAHQDEVNSSAFFRFFRNVQVEFEPIAVFGYPSNICYGLLHNKKASLD
jgi:hypothetical protein